MIVAMKKIFLVTQKKDAESAIHRLGALGIVHIEHQQPPINHQVEELKNQTQMLERVVQILKENPAAKNDIVLEDWLQKAKEIQDLHLEHEDLAEEIEKYQLLIHQWEPWGAFDPQDIKILETRGIYIRFYFIPTKELPDLPQEIICKVVSKVDGLARCLVISRGENNLSYQPLSLPLVSIGKMQEFQDQCRVQMKAVQQRLKEHAPYQSAFENRLKQLKEQIEFEEALAGMGAEESLSYLTGFCPKDSTELLRQEAKTQKWALVLAEPSSEDKVPTLIRNPPWIEMIKSVFSMMNILPGYREKDISLVFLLFFSIFFGILIGDAGYGLVFMGLTWWAGKKWGQKLTDRSPIHLMYVLSSFAFLWGIFTGTFFGQALSGGWMKPLFPWLMDNKNMQLLCFLLGATHLSIAHLWKAIVKIPSVGALSEIGWISLLWASFFLAKMLILGDPLPGFVKGLLMGGAALIILFNQPNKNIFKGMGLGLGDLALSAMNTFTDVVSYIRLFAVGTAGLAVADAFNQMALEMGKGSWVAGFFAVVILVAGHLLNIVLSMMAVLVHGVRLNILEFSSHMSIEWTGVPYAPLRKSVPIEKS